MNTKIAHPHKSTTHEELYFHIDDVASVFFRKENDGVWYGCAALRNPDDQFCRRTGRQVARRRYFQFRDANYGFSVERPSYEDAVDVMQLERKEFGLEEIV